MDKYIFLLIQILSFDRMFTPWRYDLFIEANDVFISSEGPLNLLPLWPLSLSILLQIMWRKECRAYKIDTGF